MKAACGDLWLPHSGKGSSFCWSVCTLENIQDWMSSSSALLTYILGKVSKASIEHRRSAGSKCQNWKNGVEDFLLHFFRQNLIFYPQNGTRYVRHKTVGKFDDDRSGNGYDPIWMHSNKTETANRCQRSAMRDTASPKYTSVYRVY